MLKFLKMQMHGYIISNYEISEEKLREKIDYIIENDLIKNMSKNALKLAPGDALEEIYNEIINVLKDR